ncbi:hypothetical protein MKZ38_008672 [Zalerion maritima]|uniref:Inner kinetochore subunit AME1 domain-containing protein n=1 Tax=Zalerion maritima TaxID=339359 RepID=A0AAD5WMM3_9PEZI|nr:hypothetical protein MKZ38_008672 [Zalerion maritima]
MASREERMSQRMRGAQRHQVGDISFGPLFPVAEEAPPAQPQQPTAPPPVTSSNTRSTPNASNISVKRARLATDPSPLAPNQPVRRRSPRNQGSARSSQGPSSQGREDPYSMPNTSNESVETAKSAYSEGRAPGTTSSQAKRRAASRPPIMSLAQALEDNAEDELESLPDPVPRRFVRSPVEEVTESPLNAPGSGHRRRVTAIGSSSVAQSTNRLQQIVAKEDELTAGLDSFVSSSPLVRKTRRSTTSAIPRSLRISGVGPSPLAAGADELDELSPEQAKYGVVEEVNGEPVEIDHDETTELLRGGQDILRRGMVETSPILDSGGFELPDLSQLQPLAEEEDPAEADENAEEINDAEAAQALRRKKPRTSLPPAAPESPDLSSPPKRRGRRKRRELEPSPPEAPAEEQAEAPPKRRGRKKKEQPPAEPEPESEIEVAEPEPEPEADPEVEPEVGPEPEPEMVEKKVPGRRGRKKRQQEPQPEEADVESEVEEEAGPRPRRSTRKSTEGDQSSVLQDEAAREVAKLAPVAGKRGRKRKAIEPESVEEPEPASEPEAEAEPEPEPEPQVNDQAEERPRKKSRKSQDHAQPSRRRKTQDGQKTLAIKKSGAKGGIPITVQRFARIPFATEDKEDDILQSDIPFVNHLGVNIVDVVAQVCEELLGANLAALETALVEGDNDRQTKKELRVKYKALEAYQEELQTRLLEHAVALDNLYGLQKRVRVVQKEKLMLRDEILEVRRERDEVEVRMDAVRVGHERDGRVALHQIGLSTNMHNVDLALEAGNQADELTSAQKKVADLNNLELMIEMVVDEASSKSRSGGALKQIREFNAFLERAAGALERR